MIVGLQATTLNDVVSAAGRACPVQSKFFAQTPSIKSLVEHVRSQPRTRNRRGSTAESGSKTVSTTRSPSGSKPEDEAVIATVEQSQPTLDQKQVVKAIAGHLISLLDDSSSLPAFEGKQTPSIPIHDYVDRLIRYVDAWAGEKPSIASTGVSAALMGIEYLDRLGCGVSTRSIHRLYMCAVLVAVKFSEDFSISNRFWAKVGGIDLDEMNRLEVSFCSMLNWKLKVSREEFESQQLRFAEPVF
jgi:hypothetical protein